MHQVVDYHLWREAHLRTQLRRKIGRTYARGFPNGVNAAKSIRHYSLLVTNVGGLWSLRLIRRVMNGTLSYRATMSDQFLGLCRWG